MPFFYKDYVMAIEAKTNSLVHILVSPRLNQHSRWFGGRKTIESPNNLALKCSCDCTWILPLLSTYWNMKCTCKEALP